MEKKEYYIAGIHPVTEAIESNRNIEKVMFKQGLEGSQFRVLLEKIQQKGIQVQFVPAERLNRISRANHQGVIAFLPQVDYFSLEDIVAFAAKKEGLPLILILDGVSDVRNFGAIARSAECAGANAIIVPAKGSANINADAVKTSAGALLRIPVCKVSNIREAIFYLKQSGYKIFASTEKSSNNIYDVKFGEPCAIIMGSEEKGISRSAEDLCDESFKIPMAGQISSLNVSAAATVVLFEALRQRNA